MAPVGMTPSRPAAKRPAPASRKAPAATKAAPKAPRARAARTPASAAPARASRATPRPAVDPAPVPPPDPPAPPSPAPGWIPVPPARPEDAKRTGVVGWHILLALGLAVLGLYFLVGLVGGAALLFAPGSDFAREVEEAGADAGKADIWLSVAFSVVFFTTIPLLWVAGTRVEPVEGTRRYLQLWRFWPSFGMGLLIALGLLSAVLALSVAWTFATEGRAGVEELFSAEGTEGENPAVEAIARNLDPFLVVAVALAAGVGEEIFFRGVLQKWVGVWGQAILFGLFHAGGGYVPQLVVAFGIGILFGHLVRRGASLWMTITAHAAYDLALLAGAYLSR